MHDAGIPAINVTELQRQTDVTLTLTAKQVSAMLADTPWVACAVTLTGGTLEAVGEQSDSAPLHSSGRSVRARRAGHTSLHCEV